MIPFMWWDINKALYVLVFHVKLLTKVRPKILILGRFFMGKIIIPLFSSNLLVTDLFLECI